MLEAVRPVSLFDRKSGSIRAAASFFAFTEYKTSIACTSFVYLFTTKVAIYGLLNLFFAMPIRT